MLSGLQAAAILTKQPPAIFVAVVTFRFSSGILGQGPLKNILILPVKQV